MGLTSQIITLLIPKASPNENQPSTGQAERQSGSHENLSPLPRAAGAWDILLARATRTFSKESRAEVFVFFLLNHRA